MECFHAEDKHQFVCFFLNGQLTFELQYTTLVLTLKCH